MQEIFKDIPGYEGKYQVSNQGNVKSLNYNRSLGCKLLKPQLLYNGYLRVQLAHGKRFTIHRLVLLAFLGSSELIVNHKNGIKTDNYLENLEYCTHQDNVIHSFKELGKVSPNKGKFGIENKLSKKIAQMDTNGKILNIWSGISEASRMLGCDISAISRCCQGKMRTHKSFTWKYL